MDLTNDENLLLEEIAFPADVIAIIKENVTVHLKPLHLEMFDEERNLTKSTLKGLSFLISETESKKLIFNLRERLVSKGYLTFIEKIHYAFENMEDEDSENLTGNRHQIGIIKCQDPYELVRLVRTDAANYDLNTEDIINKLKSWEKIASFQIFGIAYDWLELDFTKLPEDMTAFARDIYEFCPDTLEQGYVGPKLDDNYDWGDFEEAFDNQTVEDLANYITENKSIFLWWD